MATDRAATRTPRDRKRPARTRLCACAASPHADAAHRRNRARREAFTRRPCRAFNRRARLATFTRRARHAPVLRDDRRALDRCPRDTIDRHARDAFRRCARDAIDRHARDAFRRCACDAIDGRTRVDALGGDACLAVFGSVSRTGGSGAAAIGCGSFGCGRTRVWIGLGAGASRHRSTARVSAGTASRGCRDGAAKHCAYHLCACAHAKRLRACGQRPRGTGNGRRTGNEQRRRGTGNGRRTSSGQHGRAKRRHGDRQRLCGDAQSRCTERDGLAERGCKRHHLCGDRERSIYRSGRHLDNEHR